MDPLSIAASIIAIVGATKAITKLGKELVQLRKAPANLLAAMNEVSYSTKFAHWRLAEGDLAFQLISVDI